jgi:hypothetical protein
MTTHINKTTYLHGIYLTDKLKCENIGATGTLHSLMYASLIVPGSRSDYYTVPFDQLETKADDIFAGLINPRSAVLVQASLLRKGVKLKDSLTGKPITAEQEKKILNKADVELAFEKHRRSLDSGMPSRLTCLFLAEDDEDINGRLNIQDMLTRLDWKPQVLQVEIENQLALHKADNRWYDYYFDDPKPEYIVNYWNGTPLDAVPTWEFLLEGSVRLTSQNDIELVISQGSFK